MESVADEQVQFEDNEGSQLSSTCLRIPLILNPILKHCSNSELLQLSLVNKLWNYEARSVIKDRGTLTAYLRSHRPCQDLALFTSHLRQMNVVPYSGIFIDLNHPGYSEEPCSSEPLDSMIDVIRDRLPLKHFEVRFGGYWEVDCGCPAVLWVKPILKYGCRILKSLHVDLHHDIEKFIRQTIHHSIFPHLKTLKLRTLSPRLEEPETTLIKTLVSRAPKLQELFLDDPVEIQTDILEGSSAVLDLGQAINPLRAELHHGLISALRLRKMLLEYHTGRNFSMDGFNRIVPIRGVAREGCPWASPARPVPAGTGRACP